jgi:DNA polymerase elongation subunit (family B)
MTSWVGIRPLGRAFAATGRYPGTFPHDMDSLVESINSGGSRGGTVEAFPDEARLLRRVFSLLLHHDPDVIVGHNIAGFDLDVLLASAKRQVHILFLISMRHAPYMRSVCMHAGTVIVQCFLIERPSSQAQRYCVPLLSSDARCHVPVV